MAEWNFNVNLAGIAPAGAGARKLPSGYYKGKIVEADGTVASTGRPQVMFKVEITDADYAGIVRTTWLGIPQSAEDNVRYYWRAAFESAGYTPAQIEAGTINASPALFLGREVTVHFIAGDKDAGQSDKLNFLSPSAYEAGKRAEGGMAGATGAALTAKVSVPSAFGGGMGASVQTPTAAPMGGGLVAGLGAGLGGMAAKPAAAGAINPADLLKALGAQ
jgi:hypothetical protein